MDPSKSIFQWQQSRRRKDGWRGGSPVSGFGADGAYTLWLPSSKPTSRYDMVDGKWRRIVEDGLSREPDIVRLRNRVLTTMRADGGGWVSVDLAFLDYVTAVIRLNYDASDEDVTFLLGRGTAWQEPMIRHLLGGDDLVEALEQLDPDLLDRLGEHLPVPVLEPEVYVPPPRLASRVQGWRRAIGGLFQRIMR